MSRPKIELFNRHRRVSFLRRVIRQTRGQISSSLVFEFPFAWNFWTRI